MRRLLPEPADLPLEEVYADLQLGDARGGPGRPTVTLGMVASVDGAVTWDGTSGRLGGDGDRQAFRRSRDAADAILVGAGTVRAEGYGPPRAPRQRAAARIARGAAPGPQLVVVTARADLDPAARLFTAPRDEGVPAPVVVTCRAAPRERVAALGEVAEVVEVGDGAVDLARVLDWCAGRGFERILCEGGPRLNGALLDAGLVDEVLVTVAPVLLGGDADRIVASPQQTPADLVLAEVHEHDGELLLRYVAASGRPSGGHDEERC